jgi:hypothetical protein
VINLVAKGEFVLTAALPICIEESLICVVECSHTGDGPRDSKPMALLLARAAADSGLGADGATGKVKAMSIRPGSDEDAAKLGACLVEPKDFYHLLGSGRYALETAETLETVDHKICYRNGQLLIAGPGQVVPKRANETKSGPSSSAPPKMVRPGPTSMHMDALCAKLVGNKAFRILSVAREEVTSKEIRFASLGGVRVTIGKP